MEDDFDFMKMFEGMQLDRPGASYVYKAHPHFDKYSEILKEAVRACARTVAACDVILNRNEIPSS